MSDPNKPFTLHDHVLLAYLRGGDPQFPRTSSLGIKPRAFQNLQYPEIAEAFFNGSYRKIPGMLKKLPGPLPPKDAAAACLCALPASVALMTDLLNHCPPLPEFQFEGIGRVTSLLGIAARFDKHKMLDLFLKRGADPNGNPNQPHVRSPVEEAFCSNAYRSLTRLLKCPDVKVELTDSIREHWSRLAYDPDDTYPQPLWCSQLLLETLTGKPADPDDPFPIPAELTLEDVLSCSNLNLAMYMCSTRTLTNADKMAALKHLIGHHPPELYNEYHSDSQVRDYRLASYFLMSLLDACPDLLQHPVVRTSLAAAAIAFPKPEPAFRRWVDRLEDGPIFLPNLPEGVRHVTRQSERVTLEDDFFPRWDERLGRRLVPTMSIQTNLHLKNLSDDEIRLLLERVPFTGQRQPDKICPLSAQLMQYAPSDMLPELIQPGNLLALEHPHAILDACEQLSPDRRNMLLPYLHKEVQYDL